MRVDIVTKEYPPEIYGGAGVHVTELVRALRESIDVRVHAFGADRDEVDEQPARALHLVAFGLQQQGLG